MSPFSLCIAIVLSDSGGIQTHDLQNRNLTLYSAKLPSLVLSPQRYGKKRLAVSLWPLAVSLWLLAVGRVTRCRDARSVRPSPNQRDYAVTFVLQRTHRSCVPTGSRPGASPRRPAVGWVNSTSDRYNYLELTTYQNRAVSGKSDFHVDISKCPRGE